MTTPAALPGQVQGMSIRPTRPLPARLDRDGLPVGLTHRTETCLAYGMATPSQLRGAGWTRPEHGLVRPAGADPGQPMLRIHDAVARAGPDGVLGGWACAHVLGVSTLDGLDLRARVRPVLVLTPTGQLRPRPGLEPSRMRLRSDEIEVVNQLKVTSLARAVYDEMLRAGSVREALDRPRGRGEHRDVGRARRVGFGPPARRGAQEDPRHRPRTRGGADRLRARGEPG